MHEMEILFAQAYGKLYNVITVKDIYVYTDRSIRKVEL